MIRRLSPILWIVLFILIVAGMWRLRFDVDVLNLLPRELPVVRGLQLYQRHFTDSRELIVTVSAGDAEQTETAARLLATALRGQSNLVSSVMWQPAWMERPLDAAELIGFLWFNQPPAVFGELTNHLIGTNIAATVAEARDQLATSLSPLDLARRSYDPFNLLALPASATGGAAASFGEGQNLFASSDGTFRILFVKASSDLSNYRACIEWLQRIKAVVHAQRTDRTFPSNAVIAFTGGPAFVSEISGGMEHDMRSSVGITSAIIAILFWIFHRRLVPMLWLLVLLGLILVCTLALGGLFFGAINVVSLGFAGILLGLAVDYGVVHYQEAMASPNAIIPEIRRAIGPSIFWAAVTTIGAFLVLNLSGLPGLAQLGSLVALGVMLSALVMLFAFLPPLFRDRLRKRREQISERGSGSRSDFDIPNLRVADPRSAAQPDPLSSSRKRTAFAFTAMLILAPVAVLLVSGFPRIDSSSDALRPRNSPAYVALDEMKARLSGNREPLWLIAQGRNETEIVRQFESAVPLLNQAVSNQVLADFTLPLMLWPQPEYQAANRVAASAIVAQRGNLHATALEQGFTPDALRVTDAILNTWQAALNGSNVFWPTNEMSSWVIDKVAARETNGFIGVGFLFPSRTENRTAIATSELADALGTRGLILSGWQLLGSSILKRVQQNLWKVLLPMILLVLVSLWLAFRRPTEICLSLAVLAVSGLALTAAMRLFGWSWNLMNLMALPLMLGSGVDYSIFMQLALRRHGGNLAAAHRAVGRALLLCGGTAVAGFGSLSFSTNAGMASLGEVCATGIGLNMLIAVFLLPTWWRILRRGQLQSENSIDRESADRMLASETSAPSSLYRAGFWRVGLWTARLLPRGVCLAMGRVLASAYWHLRPSRREVVIENLLPVLNGDRMIAKAKARQLFSQFSVKLVDLWRYEAGLSIRHLMGQTSGWEHFTRAQAEKRGVLVITPHLGNWEFGGPALTERGIQLQVVTLAEPGRNFTELRQASRARWNVETLVIGNDPFAVLEIIKRLESGAVVALLIDRPPATSAIEVEFCGRPFSASVAAAELARATGCVVLPVYLPREGDAYAARVLPPVQYERAALRDAAARRQLTQQIMRAFEPIIRQYPDQWYHFVPIWPPEK